MMFAAMFAVLVGLLLLGTGISLIVGNQMPTVEENTVSAVCQWVAEFTTAILLVASGFGLLLGSAWAQPIFLIALAMLLLTVIGTLANYSRWQREREERRGAGSGILVALLIPFLMSSF